MSQILRNDLEQKEMRKRVFDERKPSNTKTDLGDNSLISNMIHKEIKKKIKN